MDILLKHLELSASQVAPAGHADPAQAHRRYVELFKKSSEPNWQDCRWPLDYDRALILAVMTWLFRQQQFEIGGGADYARGLISASLEREYDGKEGWLAYIPRLGERLCLTFEVQAHVAENGTTLLRVSRSLPSWIEEFQKRLRQLLEDTPPEILEIVPRPSGHAYPHHPVLGPGEELEGPFTGNLRDYSGCARQEELQSLFTGDLPLGRYAFGKTPETIRHGRSLYLSRYRTGGPMLYNGALLCAPQNSGKTELLLRWAQAANRAGYSLFLVDVKGNMRAKLEGRLRGKVYYFSTDPYVTRCSRINFLAGLKGDTPLDGMRIRQLVEALLPKQGWEEGEQAYFYQNRVNWTAALIHLLLLYQHYFPEEFPGGEANLSHLYALASGEPFLYACIDNIRWKEQILAGQGKPVPFPGLDYWVSEIALLIHPERGGQRSHEYSYRTLTQSIVNALRPFSAFGTLYTKIGGVREGDPPMEAEPFFSFEFLNDSMEPVTILLAAREQDLDDATTVVSMAVKRLEQFLFDRMSMAAPRPVLLLLDETRRIRSFKANEYITFAREAKAGCVLVYQSLDQIGEREQIVEILENIGTQVYLGSLVGHTAQYFLEILPARFRPTYSINASFGSEGMTRAIQTGQEVVGYFTTNELYRLPAGKWPALVYINDQPRRKPFLVDLDNALPESR